MHATSPVSRQPCQPPPPVTTTTTTRQLNGAVWPFTAPYQRRTVHDITAAARRMIATTALHFLRP
ncbi:MAG: hypothetical protein V4614_13420 [Pseudomonadota bacterium]